MQPVPPFDAQDLEAIAKILADTDRGLTGSQIAYLLQDCRVKDVDPSNTKWKRLFNAFVEWQNEKKLGNHVLMFINRAMKPVRYTTDRDGFEFRRNELNKILLLLGMVVGDDGLVRRTEKACNLTDALRRANRLQEALESRGVHEDVLRFCRAELVEENYFHAVFEAMKSIAAKVRTMSGLTSDGAALVTEAFSLGASGAPLLAINALATETDKGEQRGFTNLLIGLFGTIRNPAAHNPKVEWPMSERDALDILTIASLVHRKIDAARKTTP